MIRNINNQECLFLKIGNVEREAPLSALPLISPETKEIFADLQYPIAQSFNYPYKFRGKTLFDTAKELDDTKNHPIRNKLWALFRSALSVGIVAGGVLALATATAPSAAPMILFPAALLAYSILATYNGWRIGLIDNSVDLGEMALCLLTAPLMPIFEIFFNTWRLERSYSNQKQELEELISKFQPFFKSDLAPLEHALNQKIAECQIMVSSDLVKKIPSVQKEIESKKKAYESAFSELHTARQFYNIYQL